MGRNTGECSHARPCSLAAVTWGDLTLSRLVGAMKRHSARRINELNRVAGRCVWQRGFHDHALRGDESVPAVARYIVANPLRSGLVNRIGDYSLWDAVWL